MAVSYNKLWKLLIDKKMKKKDLQAAADIDNHDINEGMRCFKMRYR